MIEIKKFCNQFTEEEKVEIFFLDIFDDICDSEYSQMSFENSINSLIEEDYFVDLVQEIEKIGIKVLYK